MEHEKVGEFVLNSDYEHALRPNFSSNVIVFIGSLIRIIPWHFATGVAVTSAFHWQLEPTTVFCTWQTFHAKNIQLLLGHDDRKFQEQKTSI